MWRGRLNSRNLRSLVNRLLKDRVNLLRLAVIVLFLYLAERGITATFRDWDWVTVNSVVGQYWATILKSIGPELGGIVIGVVIIDWLNERRQENQLKEQLIMQLGSKYPDVADSALRMLWTHGNDPPEDSWVTDGTLKKADLQKACLPDANFYGANLEGANLSEANLKGAELFEANLKGANLLKADLTGKTNLEGANLVEANLYEADLMEAFLVNANLERANLILADLTNANMPNANLKQVKLLEARLVMAILNDANLEEADLGDAILEWAYLMDTNLEKAKSLTDKQLKSASVLIGAIMPDGTRLISEENNNHNVAPFFLLDNNNLGEWLQSQSQLHPDERAVYLTSEARELIGQALSLLTESQIDGLKHQAREVAQRTGVHINRIYVQIRQEFHVKSISELNQSRYPVVMEFLEHLGNKLYSTEEE